MGRECQSVFSVQSLGSDFFLSRHRLQGHIQPGVGIAEIYGDPGMSGSPILGTHDNISTDSADTDGDVVGILRGSIGQRMLRITFITSEAIKAAAKYTNVDQNINWI